MQPEDSQSTPIGILLITTYWIFLAAYFFIIAGSSIRYTNLFSLIYVLLGTALIVLSWGILILKKWAITWSIIVSLIGLIFSSFAIPMLIYGLFYRFSYFILPLLIWISFLAIFLYLILKKNKLIKKPQQILKFCPICGKNITINSGICINCKKDFEQLNNKN